jgi:hypothetical protein
MKRWFREHSIITNLSIAKTRPARYNALFLPKKGVVSLEYKGWFLS